MESYKLLGTKKLFYPNNLIISVKIYKAVYRMLKVGKFKEIECEVENFTNKLNSATYELMNKSLQSFQELISKQILLLN